MISIHNIDVVVVMGDFGWVLPVVEPVVARFVAAAATGHFDRMMMMMASLSYSFTTSTSESKDCTIELR